MNADQRRRNPPAWRGWALLFAAMAATFLLGLLAASILQRREEARQTTPLDPIGELAGVRKLVRDAQLRWDYVASNNGMGFHSPEECVRILATAIDLAGQCRVECARVLARHGVTKPIAYPDFGTKEKAQKLIRSFVEGKPPKLL